MCVQQRFKSVCASVQSDQSLSFIPEETLDPWVTIDCPSKTQKQTVQMGRLIGVFDGCKCQLVPLAVPFPLIIDLLNQ